MSRLLQPPRNSNDTVVSRLGSVFVSYPVDVQVCVFLQHDRKPVKCESTAVHFRPQGLCAKLASVLHRVLPHTIPSDRASTLAALRKLASEMENELGTFHSRLSQSAQTAVEDESTTANLPVGGLLQQSRQENNELNLLGVPQRGEDCTRPKKQGNIVYQKPANARTFRTLVLLPGSGNNTVCGRLRQSLSIDLPQQYEALSYRWSEYDPANPTFIRIDSVDCPIGPQLYTALLQFRQSTDERELWVDQICIDQEDESDKASQIAIMADIYTHAKRVLIWLGPAADQSDTAMEYFPALIDQVEEASRNNTTPDLPPSYGSLAIAMHHLFSREWFSRVWTLQEAALGNLVEVWCGEKSFSFEHLLKFQRGCEDDPRGLWADVLDFISSGLGGGRDPDHPHRPINTCIEIIRRLRSNEPLSNTRLLNVLRFMDCSLHQDRINSILRFLSPELKETVTDQPGLPAADIFRLVACDEIGRGEVVHLCAAGLSQHRISYETSDAERPCLLLPSWVPDWTFTIKMHSLWVYNAERITKIGTSLFQAGGSYNKGTKAEVTEDGQELLVEAIVFDSIADFTEPYHATRVPQDVTDTQAIWNAGISTMRYHRSYRLSSIEKAKQCESRYELEGIEQACKRTLVGGMLASGPHRFTSVADRITDDSLNQLFSEFETLCINLERMLQLQQAFPALTDEESGEFLRLLNVLPALQANGSKLIGSMAEACKGRKFVVTTDERFVGLAPDITALGDKICVVPGCCAPFVIRPDGDKFRLIGECYIEGVMDGEIMSSKAEAMRLISLI